MNFIIFVCVCWHFYKKESGREVTVQFKAVCSEISEISLRYHHGWHQDKKRTYGKHMEKSSFSKFQHLQSGLWLCHLQCPAQTITAFATVHVR